MNKLNDFNLFSKKKVLFIGCHPDDVELGCGGLLNRLKNISSTYVLTLSKNQKNIKNRNLIKEQKQSLTCLGVNSNKILYGDFITREFSYVRQEICDFLLKIKKKINPDVIFTTPFDLHQDHQVCNNETLRIFRDKTIIEYNLIRSTVFPKPNFVITLNEKDLKIKNKAISYYKTYKSKNYFPGSVISSLMKPAGIRFETPLCEVYNVVTIIL